MLVLTLLPFALAFTLYSETAAQWSARALQLGLVGMEVQKVSGRLAGPLAVDGLRYRSGTGVFSVDHIEIAWQPAQLLFGKLHIHRVATRGLTVTLPAADKSPQQTRRQPVELPFSIRADRIKMRDTAVVIGERAPIVVDTLDARLRTDGDELIVEALQIDASSPHVRVDASGLLPIDGRGPLRLEIEAQGDIAGQAMQARLSARGSTRALQAEAELLAPLQIRIDGDGELEGRQPSWQAVAQIEPFELDRLVPGARALRVEAGTVEARGNGPVISAQARIDASDAEFGDWTLFADGDWDGQRWALPHFLLTDAGAARISGRAGEGAEGEMSADVQWEALAWPPQDPRIVSPSGKASIAGRTQDYRYRASAEVRPGDLPPASLELAGHGNGDGITLDTLSGRWLQGKWQGSARLAWAPALQGHLEADIAGIDLSGLHSATQGIGIDGVRIAVDAGQEDGSPRIDARFDALQGKAFGRSLSGHGRVRAVPAEGRIDAGELVLAAGASEFRIEGRIAEQWDVDWRVQVPDLSEPLAGLLSGISGSAQASGTLSGPPAALHAAATLRARDLAWNDQRAADVVLTAQTDLDADPEHGVAGMLESLRWQAELLGDGVASGEIDIGRVTFHTDGTLASHQATLRTEHERLQFSQQIDDGGLQDGHWTGMLTHGRLMQASIGLWTQTAPATLGVSAEKLALQPLCWESAGARICAGGSRAAEGDALDGEIEWQDFELQRLYPLLPAELIEITGRSSGRIAAVRTGGAPPHAQLEVQVRTGTIRYAHPQQRTLQTLDYQDATLRADLDDDGARASFSLALGKSERIDATLALPGYALAGAPAPEQRIAGALKADIGNLGALALFIPDILPTGARAGADITLSGTLGAPLLDGHAELAIDKVSVLRLGTQIEAVHLRMQAHGNTLALDGGARMGGGELTFDGDGSVLSAQDWSARLTVKGDSLEVVRLPTAHIKASPDITLQMRPGELLFNGRLSVPWARLEPVRPEEGSTVALSDDVVIVGGPPAAPRQPLYMKGRIEFVLGDDVRLAGRGFEGRLTGRALIMIGGEDVTAQGEVNFVDGRFRAYGQNLAITQGRVLYAGGPIDNPAIDIIASRTRGDRDEIEVGVRILGTAHAPTIELHSSPAMDDADILSYLIIGRPISEARAGEGEDLYRAAGSLAIAGGSALAEQIGERFNLVEISIETGTQTQDTALVLGRSLSPRLYVRYIRGLMEENNAIQFRYQLGRNWTIETESGTRTGAGADILYSLER